MNGFQLVKTVLDELYEQIYVDFGEYRDNAINNKLDYLGATYRQLTEGGQVIYSDPVTRFAYIYRYTTAHADIVYQLICRSKELRKLFNKKRIQISCLGGGPGSDLLGVLKYVLLKEPENLQQVICTMWDQEEAWADSWIDINSKLDIYSPNISTSSRRLDVTNSVQPLTVQKICNADLFTMVYFLSEVYHFREDARSFFEAMFQQMKRGTYLLFIDNNDQRFYRWLDMLVSEFEIDCIEEDCDVSFQTGYDEEKKALGEYLERFKHPKLTAQIAYRIYYKA